MTAAANGEAVIVNGGIHLETSSVNCVAQYAAPGCSDHQPVTKHTHGYTHADEHTEPLRSLVLRGGNVITPPQRARHREGEERRRRGAVGGREESMKRGEMIQGERRRGGRRRRRDGEIDVSYHLIWAIEPRRQIR